MLDATRYYTDMEKFLICVGKYVMILSLYRDLLKDEPSPDSKAVLEDDFENDMGNLYHAYNSLFKKCPQYWVYVRDFLKEMGDYDQGDATKFLKYIQRNNGHTDFREKALEWTRTQLKKLAKNEEVPIYNLHDYITSYNYLVLERRKKSGRHFKGLHKSA
jgi:hypothetical protein